MLVASAATSPDRVRVNSKPARDSTVVAGYFWQLQPSVLHNLGGLRHHLAILGLDHLDDNTLLVLCDAAAPVPAAAPIGAAGAVAARSQARARARAVAVTSTVTATVTTTVTAGDAAAVAAAHTLHGEGVVARCGGERRAERM